MEQIEPPTTVHYARPTGFTSSAEVIAYVILKLFGVYLVVQCVMVLLLLVPQFAVSGWYGGPEIPWYRYIGWCVPGALGLLLLAVAKPISKQLFSNAEMPVTIDLAVDQIVALISVAAGVWLTAITLPNVMMDIFAFFGKQQAAGAFAGSLPENLLINHADLIANLIQLAIGLFLFLRPGWVVGQFRRRSKMPEQAA